MKSGWISLDRKIKSHYLWGSEPFTKAQAWIDLLLSANHAPTKLMIKNTVIELKRGQQARSQVTLAKEWKWSKNKVKRFLNVLKTDHMVELQTNQHTTIITICNYGDFQDNEPASEPPNESANETVTRQQRITNNNVNKNNNINTLYKKTRIPYQLIVDSYHANCTDLAKVQILTDKRKAAIKRFWNYSEKHQNIDFIDGYFKHCNSLNFLIGNVATTGNRQAPWKADLEWLLNVDNLAKVVEGKYKNV